ncbi:MAG: hypothetical protein Q8Q09_23420 [Deltaproteobacteria bacterium]|nr:hypothetical protein [Deltaproteobacteria bacterium]
MSEQSVRLGYATHGNVYTVFLQSIVSNAWLLEHQSTDVSQVVRMASDLIATCELRRWSLVALEPFPWGVAVVAASRDALVANDDASFETWPERAAR